jgi:CheY-like chemotaxis protein
MILVVEDELAIRTLVQEVLEDEGFTVQVAADGRAGLAAARTTRPALILTDYMMPGMDGLTLLEHIRANPQLQDVPVLLMTAARNMPAQHAFHGVVPKPFSLDALIAQIQHHLA